MLYNLRLALSIGEIPNDPFMPSTQTWMGLSFNPSGLKQAGLYPFLWPLIRQGGVGRNKEAMGPPEETQCNLPSRASNILGWQEKLCTVLWHGMLLSLLPQSRGAAAMMSWGDKPGQWQRQGRRQGSRENGNGCCVEMDPPVSDFIYGEETTSPALGSCRHSQPPVSEKTRNPMYLQIKGKSRAKLAVSWSIRCSKHLLYPLAFPTNLTTLPPKLEGN